MQINLDSFIFPIMGVKKTYNTSSVGIDYAGACFLTKLANQHTFVMPAHLLEHLRDNEKLFIGYRTLDGQTSLLEVNGMQTVHLDRDIGFLIPTASMKEKYMNFFKPIKVLKANLPIGQSVIAHGFPNSYVTAAGEIYIVQTETRGKVVDYEYSNEDGASDGDMIYRLDFAAPSGSSGSPIMVVYNNTLVVAGYIIKERSTISGPNAYAVGYKSIIEIEDLLTKAISELSSAKSS